MTFFSTLDTLPEDPILGIPLLFATDSRQVKANLGIGTYRDANGKPFVLDTVKKAEALLSQKNLDKEYLPIEGSPDFIKETLGLLFSNNPAFLKNGTVFGAQTIGGTSALRVGADFLFQHFCRNIFVSNPTWPNHHPIFSRAGFKVQNYHYYDAETNQLDFAGICSDIQKMPAGSAILLHLCCHNPTGADPTVEQWKELSSLIAKQKLLPFFDAAYQGWGNGIEPDAMPIKIFAEDGHEFLIAQSYAKNLGLYGERAGCLAVIAKNKQDMTKVASQIKSLIRNSYSNPPLHTARLVVEILQNPLLKKEFLVELDTMRLRVEEMRRNLYELLQERNDKKNFSFFLAQKGLFSLLGLTPEQVLHLRKEFAIYLPNNGRINIAGLNMSNINYVADSVSNILSLK